MEQKMKFCQSCGMPLTNEVLGTNADGSKNEDYWRKELTIEDNDSRNFVL